MCIFKTFFAMILAASFLVGCSGGGSDSGSTVTSSGSTASLFAAYEAITPDMNVGQITSLVGYAPNNGTSGSADGSSRASWDSGKGAIPYAVLDVYFKAGGGVEYKIFGGQNGTFSQSY